MRLRDVSVVAVAVVAMLSQSLSPAKAQFNDLFRRVPGGANSLVMIDVDALYRSPMAQSKGWKAQFATKWSEQPIVLPPEARRFVLASHLDPLNNMRSDWEIAVIDLAEPLSLNTIARTEGGYIEAVGDTPVVWTPSHAYFIQFEKNLLGLVYPDDRQAVGRWIDLSKTGQLAPVSPYLAEASKRLRSRGQIVMAIDLTNVAQPHRIDKALKETRILEGKKVSPQAVAVALSSLRGLTLSIEFRSQAMAEARIDFSENVRILEPFAKELVLKGLERAGLAVADASAWKVKVEETAIIFRGTISEKGLRRISSLLELPTSKFSTMSAEIKKKVEPSGTTVEASQRYFKSLDRMITDLREQLRTTDTVTAWLDRTARKIDAMPILHVDEELLAFGGIVAKSLREMGEQRRNVGRANAVAQSTLYGNYYDVGSYGGGSGYYRDSGSTSATLGEQSMAAVSAIKTKGLQGIYDGLADIRRKMTKKYGVEF